MLLFLVIFFLLSACSFLAVSRTRRYQLGQLAKHYHLQHEYYRESITTVETAGRLEFFTQFFHQYYNVCTFSNEAAFMRLADDVFFADDKPGTKAQKIFVFTAELKNQQFMPFKIVPVGSVFAQSHYPVVKTNVPEIDKHYQIYSPIKDLSAFLTPALLSVLKNRRNIYLEANDNALAYHESALTRPQDFQTFRLRGMQLLHECIQRPENARTHQNENATTQPSAPFVAGLILPQVTEDRPNAWMGMGIMALLLLAIGLTLFAWILIKNLPH